MPHGIKQVMQTICHYARHVETGEDVMTANPLMLTTSCIEGHVYMHTSLVCTADATDAISSVLAMHTLVY